MAENKIYLTTLSAFRRFEDVPGPRNISLGIYFYLKYLPSDGTFPQKNANHPPKIISKGGGVVGSG
jgi:hypothetical protein